MREIEIIRGGAARDYLNNESCITAWNGLYQRCPWATVYQAAKFVRIWYSLYSDFWEPVLVVENGVDGPKGILALALSADRSLAVCGIHECEYPSWLADSEVRETFIIRAVERLWCEFPSAATLVFQYLPPHVPIGSLHRVRAVVEPYARPLMRLNRDDLQSLSKRKHAASNWNRLRRQGSVSIVEPANRAELEPYMDAIADACDWRHGTYHNFRPFAADPLKREWHLRLVEARLQRATLMLVGGRLAAVNIGMRDSGTLAIGMITHTEEFAQHSPQHLLILRLALKLLDEGYEYIDLTPGGTSMSYKERLSNERDEVYLVKMFARNGPYLLERAKSWSRKKGLTQRLAAIAGWQ